jgi:DNA gyrase subunit A
MASMMNIEDVALHEAAQERYLSYAMSVITSRALPDVRDGLKPVQRRIMYAMFTNLRLTHQAKHRKSAAVTGEVMAKYHPHGDQSIYDAMVRMAQDFSMRYPLVDGQGNFGSIDGDSAAAMRYTESRLTQIAGELIDEIRKQTVPFRPNYDGTTEEPVVLPAQVPNMLINGATGIAVGMATNIPPHNLGEVVDALMALIKKPELSIEALMTAHFKGPDFPTGGVLLEDHDALLKIYEKGHGSVTIRADWRVEDSESSSHRKQIVISSIPYTVTKSSLIEKIADHVMKGKLPQIDDVRDESTDEVRVVLELKRGCDPNAAMAYLFKYTPLQHRFHINLTCLVPTENDQVCTPARLNVKDILQHFLDFRMKVLKRRLEYDLAQLEREIHRLEGFEMLFNDLDKALELIRSAEGKADAASKMMAHFELSEVQTEAILETKLYRLAKLEIEQIRADLKVKRTQAAGLETLLADDALRWREVRRELRSIRSAYGDTRRTRLSEGVKELEFSEENYIVNEHAIVIVTKDGWFKRQKSYTEIANIRVRDGDEVRWALPAKTRDTVMFFTTQGSAYTMRVNDVPSTSGYGDPVQAKFDFSDGEKIVGVMTSHKDLLARYEKLDVEPKQMALVAEAEVDGEEGVHMLAIGENGFGVRFAIEPFLEPSTVRGRACMKLGKGEQMVNCEPCRGDEIVAIATRDGRGMTFMANEIASYKNVAKGVKAIALDKKDSVLDFTLCTTNYDGLELETNRGSIQGVRASLSKFSPIARGNRGQWVIHKGHLIRSLRKPVEVRFDVQDEEPDEEPALDGINDNKEEE